MEEVSTFLSQFKIRSFCSRELNLGSRRLRPATVSIRSSAADYRESFRAAIEWKLYLTPPGATAAMNGRLVE